MLTYSLSNQLHEKIYFLNHMKILVANIVFFIKKNGHKGSTFIGIYYILIVKLVLNLL